MTVDNKRKKISVWIAGDPNCFLNPLTHCQILYWGQLYTRCFIKGPLFLSFIIHSNDDQFTQIFLPVVTEGIQIQNISTKFGSW